MAKKTSKKETKPKTEPSHEKSARSKKAEGRKTDAKSRAKAPTAKAVGTERVAQANVKPRAIFSPSPDGLDLKKAVVEVLASSSSPGRELSPAQVRVLVMRKAINLGEVAKVLESLRDEHKPKGVGRARSAGKSTRGLGESALSARGEVLEELARAHRRAAASLSVSSLGTTVDLEDAVLAVLCEEPNRPMTTDEVQGRCVRYLGYTPGRPAVVIALNSNPKVTSGGDGSYRGDCS